MRDIDGTAQTMFSRCMAEGQAVVDGWDNRHEGEAVRAELRRLSRNFKVRIATHYSESSGRVIVARADGMPWDATEEEVADRVSRRTWATTRRPSRRTGGTPAPR